jgi:hypothetical protein
MSYPEAPVPSQADQILARLDAIEARLDKQADGINNVGSLVQWITDNVKDIFAFFGSPQMMGMMGQMAGGMMPAGPTPEIPDLTGDDSDHESGDEPADGTAEPASDEHGDDN